MLLKSALMMMVRERMSEIGRRFLDSYDPGRGKGGGRGGGRIRRQIDDDDDEK